MLHAHGLIFDPPRSPLTRIMCRNAVSSARAQQMEARAVECGVNADR